ncbi:MAG TPA: TIGR03435 family protein [Acidobacteriaceae bacterium]|nr:TIGR03435 family protein [Acidobacteriaceae bacterium]
MRSRPSSLHIVFAVLLIVAGVSASAQAKPVEAINPAAKSIALAATLPAYDVVSIHQNKLGGNWSFQVTDDGIIAKNCPLLVLVQYAYNLGNLDLISGISGPLESASFDVNAKLAPRDGATPARFNDAQLQAMLIPLLADRFHLHLRLEPKMMTVYELVVAKGGPKFKLTEPETHDGSANFSFSASDNVLTAKAMPIAGLAGILSGGTLHSIVVDHTGLKGDGNFSLKWSSDAAQEQGSPNTISIFTAIQDQLGLKLQPAKLPVDTLVIDHAEMPSEN